MIPKKPLSWKVRKRGNRKRPSFKTFFLSAKRPCWRKRPYPVLERWQTKVLSELLWGDFSIAGLRAVRRTFLYLVFYLTQGDLKIYVCRKRQYFSLYRPMPLMIFEFSTYTLKCAWSLILVALPQSSSTFVSIEGQLLSLIHIWRCRRRLRCRSRWSPYH